MVSWTMELVGRRAASQRLFQRCRHAKARPPDGSRIRLAGQPSKCDKEDFGILNRDLTWAVSARSDAMNALHI